MPSFRMHFLSFVRSASTNAPPPTGGAQTSRSVALIGQVGNCQRNLAVEKALAELPAPCRYCNTLIPRGLLALHSESICPKR